MWSSMWSASVYLIYSLWVHVYDYDWKCVVQWHLLQTFCGKWIKCASATVFQINRSLMQVKACFAIHDSDVWLWDWNWLWAGIVIRDRTVPLDSFNTNCHSKICKVQTQIQKYEQCRLSERLATGLSFMIDCCKSTCRLMHPQDWCLCRLLTKGGNWKVYVYTCCILHIFNPNGDINVWYTFSALW